MTSSSSASSISKSTFHLPWSDDHINVIHMIEKAVLEGGLFAMAMPRGSGKTSFCEVACIWAVLHGHREFVCLIGSDEGHAARHARLDQDGARGQRRSAGRLSRGRLSDSRLDGIANRCNGQLFEGSGPTSVGPPRRLFCRRFRSPLQAELSRSPASRAEFAA